MEVKMRWARQAKCKMGPFNQLRPGRAAEATGISAELTTITGTGPAAWNLLCLLDPSGKTILRIPESHNENPE